MTESEANELRCTAHQIILKLMDAGRSLELELLKSHCERAIQDPSSFPPAQEQS